MRKYDIITVNARFLFGNVMEVHVEKLAFCQKHITRFDHIATH